jgi:hypothetical protein
MLGKLLWCMVSGRQKIPREYYRRPGFRLEEIFPDDPDMHLINHILDRCIVEDPKKCLTTAQELLPIVDEHLSILSRVATCSRVEYHVRVGYAERVTTRRHRELATGQWVSLSSVYLIEQFLGL